MSQKILLVLLFLATMMAWNANAKWENVQYYRYVQDKCNVELPIRMDYKGWVRNIHNINCFCKRPIIVRRHTDVKKTWKYGRSYTTKELTYLVDDGPEICPWREVDSKEDCEIGEVFEEFLDTKYTKQSSTDGYRIRNCQNARCRKPYTHNCPSIQKVYYYDDNGNMRSRCQSKRRRLRHRRFLPEYWMDFDY